VEHEINIMEQEMYPFRDDEFRVAVPYYMKEIVAEITRLARRSPDVNQRSGVSVRASITDYESLLANAMRRSIRLNEKEIVPRVSDLPYVMPAISGKVELETVEEGKEEQILDRLIQGALLAVFNRYLSVAELDDLVGSFKTGLSVEVSDMTPSQEYVRLLEKVDGLERAVAKLRVGEEPSQIASAVEFVLEGLHLNKRLNKEKVRGRVQYRG
jgi:magnesium chelatase subunit I